MTIYRPGISRQIANIQPSDKLNNQLIVSNETDFEYITEKGIFFLELFKAPDSEVSEIKDGNDVSVIAAIFSFDQEHTPLRLNNGIKIDGNIDYLKGYFLEGVLTDAS